MNVVRIQAKRWLLAGASVIGLALACPALAQPSYYRGDEYYANGPEGEVIVQAPRYHEQRDPETGAPIESVYESRPVWYGDLDLRTRWGAHALRSRISETAHAICENLDALYPVSADGDDTRRCYRRAYGDAMDQADIAISNARYYASP